MYYFNCTMLFSISLHERLTRDNSLRQYRKINIQLLKSNRNDLIRSHYSNSLESYFIYDAIRINYFQHFTFKSNVHHIFWTVAKHFAKINIGKNYLSWNFFKSKIFFKCISQFQRNLSCIYYNAVCSGYDMIKRNVLFQSSVIVICDNE